MTVLLDGGTKSAHAVISGGNLTVGADNNNVNGARADTSKSAGKVCFEVTANLGSLAVDTGVGLTNETVPTYSALAANALLGAMIYRSGVVYINGVHIANMSLITGNTIMFAVDFTNNRLWIKVDDVHGWNGDLTADPCAGTLGFDISAITPTLPGLYPVGVITSLANSETFNFGASPFVQTRPPCFGSWDGTILPPGTPTLNAVILARAAPFPSVFRASAVGGSGGGHSNLTVAATEARDTVSGTIAPTIGITGAATEASDILAANVTVLSNRHVDLGEVIYVYPDEPTIFVDHDPFGSPIFIPLEDIIQAKAATDL